MATPDMEQHSVPPGKSSDEDLNDFLCQTPTHSAINTLAADVCCPKIANHDIHRVNPFIHKLAWDDPIDKFKTVILTVILLPFRVILILGCLIIAWALANIGLFGLSKEDLRTKPLTGWRRQLRCVTAHVMRLLFLFGSFNYIRYKGERASPKEAPVICVAPHTAFFDSVCVVLFGPSAVVAKYETASLPFFGKLIDYAQPIYVCREDPHSRQSTIREIIQRANSTEDWPQILIFPEGTCTNRTSLIQFKPGAFYPGVPIQPVLMRYPNKVDTVTWTWEGPSAIQLLWRTLTKFHTFCEIEFLPVYYPSADEKADPKLYARNVRDLMARALDIPISDYTFDDCKLMTYVKNVNLPYASAIADIEKLRELTGSAPDIEETVVRNTPAFIDGNRYLTLSEFATLFHFDDKLEATVALHQIFVKPSKPDLLDVQEYLLMTLFLTTLNKPKLVFVELLFHLYGSSGYVNRSQLYDALKYVIKISLEEVDALFVQADTAHTGKINIDQFQAAIENKPLRTKLLKNNDPNHLRLQ